MAPHPHPRGLSQRPDLPHSGPADVLRFDNTYSYIHAKKVNYSVEVLLPDATSAQQIQQLGDKLGEVALEHSL